MSLKPALVLLSDKDTDAPQLPGVATVSKTEEWERGGFHLGAQTAQRGGMWIDRIWFEGQPDFRDIGRRARESQAAGAALVQRGNEQQHPDEKWPGSKDDWFDFCDLLDEYYPDVRWLEMPPSPGFPNWQEWVRLNNKPKAVHAYGPFWLMWSIVQWYLDNTEGDLYITECNPGAGNNFSLDEWARNDLVRLLNECSKHPRIKFVAYFAMRWDYSVKLVEQGKDSVDASPAVLEVLQTWKAAPLPASVPTPLPTPNPEPKPVPPPLVTSPVRVKMQDGSIKILEREEYLIGVVNGEIGSYLDRFHIAALKALAIAARAFVEQRKVVMKGKPYDVDTTDNSQLWVKGTYHPNAIRAVKETANILPMYNGKVINAMYHAASDGKTRSYLEVATERQGWPVRDVPYLVSVEAPGAAPYRAGRVGHGIGMPQWSAQYYALQGWSAKQILLHFYTGIELSGQVVEPKPEQGGKVERISRPTKHTISRDGRSPLFHIIHSTGPVSPTSFDRSIQWLESNPREVSSHKLIGPDTVVTHAPDDVGTNHCGGSRLPNGSTGRRANQDTYGTELYQSAPGVPVAPSVVALAIEEAIADNKRLGIPAERTLGHWEVDLSGKVDPVGVNMQVFRAKVAAGLAEASEPRDWPKAIWHIQERVRVSRVLGDLEASDTLLNDVLPWMEKRSKGMPASPITGDSSDWSKTMYHAEEADRYAQEQGDVIAHDTLYDEVLPFIRARRDGK